MGSVMEGMVGEGGDPRNSRADRPPRPRQGSVLWAVAAGGALGAVLRVLLGGWMLVLRPELIPLGTLTANITGSLALGFLDARLPPDPPSRLRAFAIPGFCGGFTTFSALGLEVVALLEAGQGGSALTWVVLSASMCMAGVVAGGWMGRSRGPEGAPRPGRAPTPPDAVDGR